MNCGFFVCERNVIEIRKANLTSQSKVDKNVFECC